MTILIKQAEITDKYSSFNGKVKNIWIENGVIKKITDEEPAATQSIDAKGLKISTGWFDMRASFGDPGYEHKESLESGSLAAMEGGFTGIACLPDTQPIVQTKDTVSYIKNKTRNYLVDILPYAAVTHDFKGEELTEMLDLHHAGVIAFTDGNHPLWHAGVLTRALQYAQPFNGLILQHAEEKKLTQYGQMSEGITSTYLGLKGIPHLAEELMIARDLELLDYAGGKIHFSHISSRKSVDIIRQAKKKGLNVSCDVAVANLVFDDQQLMGFDTLYKVNPPLRVLDDIKALWQGLSDGTIDTIVSDHMPQDEESKFLEFDQAEFGITGLETAFAAINTYKPSTIGINLIIEKLTSAPRKILGLDAYKIAEGVLANLTLFSETLEWEYSNESIKSKSKNSPFIGQKLNGKALAVFNKGQSYLSDFFK